jgi:1-acyl-sn-glycerol-3-phosphate acyltransferase
MTSAAPVLNPQHVATLTQVNLNDFFEATGLPARWRGPFLHRLGWMFRGPARFFAEQIVRFDNLVGERGLPAGAEWLLRQYVRALQAAGRERLPASGPALIVANHPGMADTVSLFRAIGREDLRIVALERPFLQALPNARRHLVFVPEDPGARMPAARAIVAELRAGRAVLTFPAGEIEPDPSVMRGAVESLHQWSDSVTLFARMVPDVRIVPAIVSGVISAAAQRNPIARLRRTPKGRERMAATLQIMFPAYQAVTARVAFGAPLLARDLIAAKAEVNAAVIAAARALIEHPPPEWQTLVRGLR